MFYYDGFVIKQPMKVDMLLNKKKKLLIETFVFVN